MLRSTLTPTGPHKAIIKLAMHHAPSGRRVEARGAVAVAGDGLRMILLGPGGTTALDLWICGDRYRYAIPMAQTEERGSLSEAPKGGFPVAFLRWWFLRRLQGRLLAFDDGDGARRFVLADGARIFHVTGGDPVVVAQRTERLEVSGGACGQARYRHERAGLTIDVDCESIDPDPPPARAFADPNDPSQACGGPT
jgi:hypothetical protein